MISFVNEWNSLGSYKNNNKIVLKTGIHNYLKAHSPCSHKHPFSGSHYLSYLKGGTPQSRFCASEFCEVAKGAEMFFKNSIGNDKHYF